MISADNAKCRGDAQTSPGVARRYKLHADVTLPDDSTMSGEEERTRIPGIFKRRGIYTFRYYDRQGKVRRSSAPTLAAAKRKRSELNTDVARGDHNPSTSQTFSNYADQWIETYAGRTRRGFREETRDDYKRILDADAKPFLGKMRIGDVRAQDIKAYIQHVSTREVRRGGIDQRVKPNTVRLSLAPVRAMFATALEEGIIRVNPCVGVRIATATTTQSRGKTTKRPGRSAIGDSQGSWRPCLKTGDSCLTSCRRRLSESEKRSPWNGATSTSEHGESMSGGVTTAAKSGRQRAATAVAAFP